MNECCGQLFLSSEIAFRVFPGLFSPSRTTTIGSVSCDGDCPRASRRGCDDGLSAANDRRFLTPLARTHAHPPQRERGVLFAKIELNRAAIGEEERVLCSRLGGQVSLVFLAVAQQILPDLHFPKRDQRLEFPGSGNAGFGGVVQANSASWPVEATRGLILAQ